MDGLHGVGMGWGVLGEEEDAGLSHFVSNPPRCLPEGPKWCGTGARPPREAEADGPLLNNPLFPRGRVLLATEYSNTAPLLPCDCWKHLSYPPGTDDGNKVLKEQRERKERNLNR